MKSWPTAAGDHDIVNGCERDAQESLSLPISRTSMSTTRGQAAWVCAIRRPRIIVRV